MSMASTYPNSGRISPRSVLLGLLLVVCGLAACAAPQAWEPARWERMTLAAKQATERGETAEAERLCVEALQYVDASAVQSLYDYASLLKALKQEGAEAAQATADQLREAKRQPISVFLGWIPSTELRAYAALLQERGQDAEAEAMRALADGYDRAQRAAYARHREQDPRGRCEP